MSGGGHDGGHGGNDAFMGAPGSHDTGGMVGGHGHGHGFGHYGHLGGHGGAHHERFGHNSIVFSHGHQDHAARFSFPAAFDGHPSQGGTGPEAAVDPIKDPTYGDPLASVITRAQSERMGEPPTVLMIAHEIHHGYLDRAKTWRRIAAVLSRKLFKKSRKLIRVDDRVPGIDGSKRELDFISAWHALAEAPEGNNMPDGWNEKLNSGKTFLNQECWQLGKWDSEFQDYVYDRLADIYLQVVWFVWWYAQSGTYETKLEVRLVVNKQSDANAHSYGFARQAFDEHQLIAVHLACEYSKALAAVPPSELARQQLKRCGYDPASRKHETGSFPGSKDDETELENANVDEAQKKDSDPRRDPTTAPPTIPDPPGGIGYPVDGDTSDPGPDSGAAPIVPVGIASSGVDLENVLPPLSSTGSRPRLDRVPVWQPPVRRNPVKVEVEVPKKR